MHLAKTDRSGLLIKTRKVGIRILQTETINREELMNTAQNV